jgi:hypothetical protein
MSAFIVSDETINKIVSFIDRNLYGNSIVSSEVQRALKDFGIEKIISESNEKQLNALANCLLYLNKKAVDFRYNEVNQINLIKFQDEPASEIQVLKSIHCYLYQCSEGQQFEESKLYKFIERIRDILESDIIHSLPEYEKAAWD